MNGTADLAVLNLAHDLAVILLCVCIYVSADRRMRNSRLTVLSAHSHATEMVWTRNGSNFNPCRGKNWPNIDPQMDPCLSLRRRQRPLWDLRGAGWRAVPTKGRKSAAGKGVVRQAWGRKPLFLPARIVLPKGVHKVVNMTMPNT